MVNAIVDILKGICLGFKLSLPHIFHCYVETAIGVVLTLMLLYGVNEIIKLTTIDFPASVCLMLINFGFLLCCVKVLGKKKTNKIVSIIEIPASFSLRWINIFFTPSFVTLPLSDKITAKEAFIIAAVFVIGFMVMLAFMAYVCVFLQRLLGLHKTDYMDNMHARNLQQSESEKPEGSIDSFSIEENEILPLGSSAVQEVSASASASASWEDPIRKSVEMLRNSSDNKTEISHRETLTQYVHSLPDRSKAVSLFITTYVDWIMYFILFITGIPIYFACDYALPLHLSIGVLMFFCAMLISPKWRRFFHPILVSVSLVLLIYYIFIVIKRDGFMDTLDDYKTGRTYLYLFNTEEGTTWPGAGDVLTSLMDVAIVSLSLPMFQYRQDLKKHFFVLLPPILVCSFGTFFIYPPLCYHIGISSKNSLGFVGRSVTLALGTPLVTALDGSIPLMAVCTIVSGILGVLCGDQMLGKYFLRIRPDDYVTRGISLGVNCGAISTAHLLNTDPRAAAMSSLSFVLFGTIMVILAAITPLAKVIQSWAGLDS
ncbi:hypothetical protein PACTADRAFT_70410 [Pachysolen tannophilus NRRL Y-2460]|uniref:LrgB-like protein n=1 Tax=Pachysolen tannophilus NRRL Y-2460 TaxID=669874 RepID=A0A1E4TQP7_PACTA|nr:hypothetical protein PACTADRAFT_70410 [Pachysolen tannophilus NRRL Y-2460]